jgi:hypothetical protein
MRTDSGANVSGDLAWKPSKPDASGQPLKVSALDSHPCPPRSVQPSTPRRAASVLQVNGFACFTDDEVDDAMRFIDDGETVYLALTDADAYALGFNLTSN